MGKRSRGKLFAVLSCVLLSGCSSTPVATVEPFCQEIADTCVSRDDRLTERTASKVEGDNLALRRMCRREPQCPSPSRRGLPAGPQSRPQEKRTSFMSGRPAAGASAGQREQDSPRVS